MKIGIIGSGNIGGNLGLLMARAGHEITFSSRNPEKLKNLVDKAGERTCNGSVAEAAEFGEVIILSVPFSAIEGIANEISDMVKDKIIIDTCNPYPQRDGDVAIKVRNDENMRESQYTVDRFPQSTIIKAFNTIYFEHLRDYAFRSGNERLGLPLAGDDPSTKQKVMKLIESIGFTPVDMGSIKDSVPMEVDQSLYGKLINPEEIQDIVAK